MYKYKQTGIHIAALMTGEANVTYSETYMRCILKENYFLD